METNTKLEYEMNIDKVDELIAFGRKAWRHHSDTYDAYESLIKDAISFSLEVHYHKGVVEGYQILALCHVADGIQEMVLSALRISEAFIQKYNLDESYYLELYNTYVIYYLDLLNDSRQAAKVCRKAINLAEKLKDKRMLMKLTANLGIIYIMYKQFQEGKESIAKALAYYESIRDDQKTMYCHSNLGEAHLGLGEMDEALEEFKIAMAMATIVNDEAIMEDSAIGLSQIYRMRENYTKAIYILDKVLHNYSKKVRFSKGLKLQLELVDLYCKIGDYEFANQHIILIESTVVDHPNSHYLLRYYDLKAQVAQGLEDYKQAYEMTKLYHKLYVELDHVNDDKVKDNLVAEQLTQTIERLERLGNVGRKLTALRHPKQVITTFTNELSPLMQLSNIGIGLVKGDKLKYYFYEVEADAYHQYKIPAIDSRSLSTWCIQNKKELLINHMDKEYMNYVEETSKTTTSDDGKTIQSLMNLPLIVDDEVIGVISCQSYKPMSYSSQDLETMKVIAPYVAIAIVNSSQSEALLDLSYKDQLTGLLNRHGINMKYQQLINQQKKFHDVTMIMLDLDHFKSINDKYGHVRGDDALIALGNNLATHDNNKTHLVARIGGEEFAILMVNKKEKDIRSYAETLRQEVEGIKLKTREGSIALAASLGVYQWTKAGYPTLEQLYEKADQALYKAKQNGRNRVEFGK